jgi:protein SCO1
MLIRIPQILHAVCVGLRALIYAIQNAINFDARKRRARCRGMALVLCLPGVFPVLTGCSDNDSQPVMEHMVALGTPRSVAEFELVDQHGQPFGAAGLRGRWTVLFVGFTHCPDVCPTTLGMLASVQKRLPASDPPLHVVFVSADPERDTPSRLGEYIGIFNDDWTALSGPFDQLDLLLDSLQLAYVKVPTGHGSYTIDHSTALVLIDPQAQMVGFYPAPHQPAALAADLRQLQHCADCAP